MQNVDMAKEGTTKEYNISVVKKRDGRVQTYDRRKITEALFQAVQQLDLDFSFSDLKGISLEVEKIILSNDEADIDTKAIDFVVLDVLKQHGFLDLVEGYIQRREDKEKKRENRRDVNAMIDSLLKQDKAIVNENANKDSKVFNTQRDLTAGIVGKALGLKLLPSHVANAHEKGDIHYHDLDYTPYSPMSNCCLIDFENMFENGFQIGNAEVDSPRSIQTATAQTAQIIANVASSQYGGCSFDRVDEVLAPYAELNFEKHLNTAREWIEGQDKQQAFAVEKTKKDIYDAMQSLEYEINTLYTSQGQTPFTSLGFGLGKSWIEREIQKAILTVRIKGLGKEKRTAIFPKLIFTLKKDLNLNADDPNYDIKQLALECSTKRMYPDILSYDKIVEITGSFKTPMGCRSFLQGWKNEQGEDVSVGRMNLGVVTLNIPRIAMESKGDIDRFNALLTERLSVLKDALLFKANRVMEAEPANAPILYMHGAFGERLTKEDEVSELFLNKRATVSLGYIGLYEAATVFYGHEWEDNEEAKVFTLDIMKTLKNHADEWGQESGLHVSVYSTPSESLTDRFCQLDLEKFGDVSDITDKGYYTNSFHYDVRKNPTPFEKIDFEKDYAQYTGGGFIHYCEYPKLQTNPKALEAVWDYAYDRIGYLGTNTPIDHCYECGFEGEFRPTENGFKCPQCGNTNAETCDVVKRTCGYLGNPQKRPMVDGRHKEISSRTKHMKGSGLDAS
ncbi:ribonucleoside-triphosphate reductase class III catalytic subunit [Alkalibacterium putridalgicola]|uniref:Anaerobic ribonucleoside triphosphate reductase n=1 Tax=Alkalibacterium putridalgicola TaxID=426703 RepID=A0A1H7R2M4_9LACT|nr:anaerobic ribonucleoside-triphosphate reductase [Alkalibacterium putridalgicola]GEK89042.1 anaerobic ribonucleoside triphosphate reductase [Alkalibacterium putridalgicola]SEL54501.1 ribonucleoside-triphosphate reductase class III catalytic subunit [Alkalibacterium putridalgicola]